MSLDLVCLTDCSLKCPSDCTSLDLTFSFPLSQNKSLLPWINRELFFSNDLLPLLACRLFFGPGYAPSTLVLLPGNTGSKRHHRCEFFVFSNSELTLHLPSCVTCKQPSAELVPTKFSPKSPKLS